jgi:GDP-4-dehydro-6-deoxy-D-mannose reductase
MRVLITGVTGFVGSHMADLILQNHPKVKVWGTKRYHLSRTDNIKHIQDKIEMVDVNLLETNAVNELVKTISPDIIFHFAAESFVSPSWDHPINYMSVNYNITVNLLEAIRKYSPSCIFHIPGSGEEYGEISEEELPINLKTQLNPVNPYAVSKIAQDLIGYVYFKSFGTKVIRTRAFNHEGPRRQNVFGIPWYAYQIARIEKNLQKPIIEVGHLEDRRNFTHVKDMVKAYWLAVEKCIPGELYLVGSNSENSIFSFKEALEKLILKSKVKGIKYKENSKYVRPTSVPFLIADISKFSNQTGWTPQYDFNSILDDTLNYWRNQV